MGLFLDENTTVELTAYEYDPCYPNYRKNVALCHVLPILERRMKKGDTSTDNHAYYTVEMSSVSITIDSKGAHADFLHPFWTKRKIQKFKNILTHNGAYPISFRYRRTNIAELLLVCVQVFGVVISIGYEWIKSKIAILAK